MAEACVRAFASSVVLEGPQRETWLRAGASIIAAVDAVRPGLDRTPQEVALSDIVRIHVGSGADPMTCVTCRRAWPCSTYRIAAGATS